MIYKYVFKLEGALFVEAESKASAYRIAYEELADLNWKFRSTRIQLDDIRIKEGWEWYRMVTSYEIYYERIRSAFKTENPPPRSR